MPDPNTDLRALHATLDSARDDLRRVLIRDQADRDAIFSQLVSLPCLGSSDGLAVSN
jgi:hypothetical protein